MEFSMSAFMYLKSVCRNSLLSHAPTAHTLCTANCTETAVAALVNAEQHSH